jgi:hypothetical protein
MRVRRGRADAHGAKSHCDHPAQVPATGLGGDSEDTPCVVVSPDDLNRHLQKFGGIFIREEKCAAGQAVLQGVLAAGGPAGFGAGAGGVSGCEGG